MASELQVVICLCPPSTEIRRIYYYHTWFLNVGHEDQLRKHFAEFTTFPAVVVGFLGRKHLTSSSQVETDILRMRKQASDGIWVTTFTKSKEIREIKAT